MDGNHFPTCRLCIERMSLAVFHPERRRELMKLFVITSHHIQPMTGVFVGRLFQALCSLISACERLCVLGGSACAGGDVSSVRIRTEGMSDPVPDQSSHHSHSVREDKIQTVTSGFCCCCFCKISNPPRRLCYLCHHATSSMCTSVFADSRSPLAAG